MRYLYAIVFAFLFSLGITLYSNGQNLLGIISMSLGIICWLHNTFRRRTNLIIISFSIVTLLVLCLPWNTQGVKAFAGDVKTWATAIGNNDSSGISTRGIARVEGIDASVPFFGLRVFLKPQNAKANTTYLVQLYENDQLREQQTVTWTQPQINTKQEIVLRFNFKKGEDRTYMDASWKDSNWWKDIFSINILE